MYASEKPEPTRTSSTARRSRWAGVSTPNMARRRGSVNGTSSSLKRATSSTRSISRVTSRARQVGEVTVPAGPSSNPRRRRIDSCSACGTSSPISAEARSGRKRITGGPGRSARTSASPVQRAPDVSTMSCEQRRAAAAARCGSTPFSQRFEPSVRRRRRRDEARIPTGSKFAASSRTFVVRSVTSVSSPPMIAAMATALAPSAITRSSRVSSRSCPSSVVIASPGRA